MGVRSSLGSALDPKRESPPLLRVNLVRKPTGQSDPYSKLMMPTLPFHLYGRILVALGVRLASHYPIQVEFIDSPSVMAGVKMHMEVWLICPTGGAQNSPAPVLGGIRQSVAERWVSEVLCAVPSTPKEKTHPCFASTKLGNRLASQTPILS